MAKAVAERKLGGRSRSYKNAEGGPDYDNPRMADGTRMIAGALGVAKRSPRRRSGSKRKKGDVK